MVNQSETEQNRMVPHARTLRNARENVKQMVTTGVSLQRIKSYLLRWSRWWVQTAECWSSHELLASFLDVCWDKSVYAIAASVQNSFGAEANDWVPESRLWKLQA